MPSLSELQPYLTAIGSLLSLAVLGFVIRLGILMRDAERQRAAILEERLKNVREDLDRTEKWSQREKDKLNTENESLRSQLEDVLSGSGLTMEALASGASLKETKNSIQDAVARLLERMESVDSEGDGVRNPAWHLELAKGYMASREWGKAALHFDRYVDLNPLDSEVQFSRGVAHANSRTADLPALRAFNEAIAFASEALESDMHARYLTYRASMLKRMKRLNEAEADLVLASKFATRDYEVHDLKYNLAAVYAMMGKRDQMLELVRELRGRRREIAAIRHHRGDYFAEFAHDQEFLEIIADA